MVASNSLIVDIASERALRKTWVAPCNPKNCFILSSKALRSVRLASRALVYSFVSCKESFKFERPPEKLSKLLPTFPKEAFNFFNSSSERSSIILFKNSNYLLVVFPSIAKFLYCGLTAISALCKAYKA
jgi:hypothetical protein